MGVTMDFPEVALLVSWASFCSKYISLGSSALGVSVEGR